MVGVPIKINHLMSRKSLTATVVPAACMQKKGKGGKWFMVTWVAVTRRAEQDKKNGKERDKE